jgi:hypothetical protein
LFKIKYPASFCPNTFVQHFLCLLAVFHVVV